ncbi:hypothetical protein R1flu_010293 [Riccia fluitans]|uniref:Uncharacterized protein n=1 Tax=Riccia fluitans TaxID=41844 RepID=A0ABD1Z4X5_9MARC
MRPTRGWCDWSSSERKKEKWGSRAMSPGAAAVNRAGAMSENGKSTVDLNNRTVPPIAHPTPDDAFGVAANIQYHAHYGPHFSPFKFEPEQAFYATAESVRDSLIQR